MLKVCTSYSKKVPTEQQYSSQQFHASVEVELSDALSAEELQQRIHQTFAVVRSTVESEITNHHQPVAAVPGRNASVASTSPATKTPSNGNGKATNAQIKYLTSLATEQDIRLSALNAYAKDNFNVSSIYELTKKDASALVDSLKRHQLKVAAA